ncbi:MAG: NAD(P)-dependent oxidoreductase [Propionibacteriaceae bacterium]|nr:NAD(P)-dependent oxidoreductase [Propionibacteriaceae bacterium]
MQKPTTIAIIGTGRMGGGIACNLAQQFTVVVYDLSEAAIQRCVDAGARAAATTVEAVLNADLVITSLPLPKHVLAAFAEITPHLRPGTICMDVSTVDPSTAATLEHQLEESGHHFVACPLGKGPAQADAGELPLFIGGKKEPIDALEDVFTCIGAEQYRMGGVEAATMFKLVSNLIGMTNLAVLAEGYLLCKRAGVTGDAFQTALADTGGWSYQAQLRLPWMMAGDFNQRFGVRLGLKDLRLAVDQASQWGIPTPVGALGMSQLASAAAHGYDEEDVNAVLKVLDPRGEVLGCE